MKSQCNAIECYNSE